MVHGAPGEAGRNTLRSWSLNSPAFQNSMRSGASLNPGQCDGRGTSRPAWTVSSWRTAASSSAVSA